MNKTTFRQNYVIGARVELVAQLAPGRSDYNKGVITKTTILDGSLFIYVDWDNDAGSALAEITSDNSNFRLINQGGTV